MKQIKTKPTTGVNNQDLLMYCDISRNIVRNISQEASDSGCCGHSKGEFCPMCAECEPLYCCYCDDWFDPFYFWQKHVAHDTEASFCKKCGKTINELYVPYISKSPGENYHSDCLKDENND